MTMTQDQIEALMQYVRAVASREAILATDGNTEGGYDSEVRTCEETLRRIFMVDDKQEHNAELTSPPAEKLKRSEEL